MRRVISPDAAEYSSVRDAAAGAAMASALFVLANKINGLLILIKGLVRSSYFHNTNGRWPCNTCLASNFGKVNRGLLN